ncbi:MAG: tetraacyldisaccharide 4'-kinase [Candidatus Poribacteria bacterium]|nr:MAG: tetraacyldisaccharide 4'-kinase [Candidatus Poribacteria bacterium]
MSLWWLGRPLEPAVLWAVRRRRRHPPEPIRLPVPTVGVGNLAVGGTGKTPCVIALARRALALGASVGIVLRGYRARVPRIREEGSRAFWYAHLPPGAIAPVDRVGDEALLIRSRLPEVLLGVGHPKAAVAARLVREASPSLVIVDDAFQHLRLAYDLQVVLLDARAPFHNGHLLPAGRLREPPEALQSADWVLLTYADVVPDLELVRDRVSRYIPRERILCARHRPVGLRSGRDGCPLPWEALQGREVWAVCGIGSPSGFVSTLCRLGAVPSLCAYRDHYRYGPRDWGRLERLAQERPIVTTEKDAVKWGTEVPFDYWVLEVEMEWEPREPLDAALEQLVRSGSSC